MSVQSPNSNSDPGEEHGGHAFATTHWTLVLHAGKGDSNVSRDALEILCRAYWPAIHAYIRRTGQSSEAARDLTQAFFARLLEKGLIAIADRRKGRFRTFLLTLLQRFLADQHDHDTTLKRGGGDALVSLDELVDEEGRSGPISPGLSAEQEFDRRWALATLDNALRHLQAEAEHGGHGELFARLKDHLGGGDPELTLAAIGTRLGLQEGAVKMRLSRWRSRYRELIRQEIAQTVPGLVDLEQEMQHLLAALAG